MADSRILVDTDAMRQAVSEFEKCQHEFMDAYQSMGSQVMMLYSSWKSDASTEFYTKFSELQKNLTTSEGTIKQAVDSLKTVADIWDRTNELNEQILSELGDIPENFPG